MARRPVNHGDQNTWSEVWDEYEDVSRNEDGTLKGPAVADALGEGPRPWFDVTNAAFGAAADGITDVTGAIQAAINAIPIDGGTVYFPAGVYIVNSTITVLDKNNVVLRGDGAQHGMLWQSGSPTTGTVLKRASGTTTLLSIGATGSSSTSRAVSIIGMSLDGNQLATTGLLATSIFGGTFGIHVRNCTTVNVDVTTIDLSGVEDSQLNTFETLSVRTVESSAGSAIGVRLGSGSAGLGNTSNNLFQNISIAHLNGVGLQVNDTDSNKFERINVSRSGGGTGIGVEFGASNTAFTGHARANHISMCNPGAGGATARATGFTTPAVRNIIEFYNQENGAPGPTIEPGADIKIGRDKGDIEFRRNYRTHYYATDDFSGGTAATTTIGDLNWSIVAGTITRPAAISGHPGAINIDTTAASGTTAAIRLGSVGSDTVHAGDLFDVTWVIRLNTNDSNTAIRVGISNQAGTNPPSSGGWIEKVAADTQWFGVARNSGTQTRTAALANVSTNWVKLRARRVNGSTYAFSVDDGSEVTVTSNTTSAQCVAFVQITNSAAASKTVDVDYFELAITGLTR